MKVKGAKKMTKFSSILMAWLLLANTFSAGLSMEMEKEELQLEPLNAMPVYEAEPPVVNIVVDIFVEAEKVTGCSAEILRGIAGVESDFIATAIGDGGLSHGMFQLHSLWHNYRIEKYGEFDPFNPADAAIIAGYIIQENMKSFEGDIRLAIAAYRQGVAGVMQNGATDWYIDAVLFWRKNPNKMLAFFIFQGITELGEIEDEHIGIGTQVAYQYNNTSTTEVPWWGCSSIPF
jgi:hypothetical protein